MRPPASTVYRHKLPPWRRTVAISMVFLVLSCLPIADARTLLRYHRKHRRHHHGHHGHISQPPSAFPPDVDGDSPVKPPGLPPGVHDAPPPRTRGNRPCPLSHPPSYAPTLSPVGAPRSPALAKPPSHSHAKPPLIYLTKPPAISPAEKHTVPHVKPSPVQSPAKSTPHDNVISPVASNGPAFSPANYPPAFSPAQPPRLLPVKPPTSTPAQSPAKSRTPQHNAIPPAASNGLGFSPANQPAFSPVQPPPRLPPAKPPVYYPVESPTPPHHAIPPAAAKPPMFAPSQPPALSPPAQPPSHAPAKSPTPLAAVTVKPPSSLGPTKPPTLSPGQPPQVSFAKPPAVPPAMRDAKPPSAVPPADPAGCRNVFDLRAFGASGNGSSADDTRAFRAAWKEACSAESATLLVPSDGVFTVTSTVFTGPCKPGLTFQIDGVLMPPDGPASWPEADSRRQWITFYKTDGMTLTGRGTIEGNGEEWWNLPCKPHRGPNGSTLPGPCDSPALIRFFVSNNVTVESLRIKNSPQFHLKFDNCNQVRVDGLFISSPSFSPNTDGIHVENTKSVQIYNSRINNGDDCISIGAGCSGVHIENVTCGHGHGISIGSLGVRNTRACVSNVTVRSTRILDSDNGLRIKTWQGGAGSVSSVEFAGVQMENVKNCIVIDQYYCLGTGCANQTSAVRVTGITYRDIRGTYNPQLHGGGGPIRFACSDSVACTDITMTDVELRPAGGGDALLARPYCWNAYGEVATLTVPPVYCLQEGTPESLQDHLDSCSVAELHIGIPVS